MFKTPVLFLIFNRPDLTRTVFERIRKIAPRRLFIAADGPRDDNPHDPENCRQTRMVIENMIDWDCDVKTLYRKKNLGCQMAVFEAVNWFFEQVEEGIILEDDCMASPSFFSFSESMLEKFRTHEKIMHISGGCYLPHSYFNNEGYYFSKYPFIWGWATWRRAWKFYRFEIPDAEQIILSTHHSKKEIIYWRNIADSLGRHTLNSWDFRWNFSLWRNHGLSVTSTKNLIKNIGFREDATHTSDINPHYFKAGFFDEENLPMVHPPLILVNTNADELVFKRYNLNEMSIIKKIYGRFKSKDLGKGK